MEKNLGFSRTPGTPGLPIKRQWPASRPAATTSAKRSKTKGGFVMDSDDSDEDEGNNDRFHGNSALAVSSVRPRQMIQGRGAENNASSMAIQEPNKTHLSTLLGANTKSNPPFKNGALQGSTRREEDPSNSFYKKEATSKTGNRDIGTVPWGIARPDHVAQPNPTVLTKSKILDKSSNNSNSNQANARLFQKCLASPKTFTTQSRQGKSLSNSITAQGITQKVASVSSSPAHPLKRVPPALDGMTNGVSGSHSPSQIHTSGDKRSEDVNDQSLIASPETLQKRLQYHSVVTKQSQKPSISPVKGSGLLPARLIPIQSQTSEGAVIVDSQSPKVNGRRYQQQVQTPMMTRPAPLRKNEASGVSASNSGMAPGMGLMRNTKTGDLTGGLNANVPVTQKLIPRTTLLPSAANSVHSKTVRLKANSSSAECREGAPPSMHVRNMERPTSAMPTKPIVSKVAVSPSVSEGDCIGILSLPASSGILHDAEPYFEYAVFQKVWSSEQNEDDVASLEVILHPFNDLNKANAQAENLFHAIKTQNVLQFQCQCSEWNSQRNEHGCSTILGVFAPFDYPSKKSYVKFWVQRDYVSKYANQTPRDMKLMPYVSKTAYILRLFKLIPIPRDSKHERTDEKQPSTRVYHEIPRNEVYTTLAAANRAALSMQVELSYEKVPSEEIDKKWQQQNLKDLHTKLLALDSNADGKERFWKSRFHACGGDTFELRVEPTGLCGPRN